VKEKLQARLRVLENAQTQLLNQLHAAVGAAQEVRNLLNLVEENEREETLNPGSGVQDEADQSLEEEEVAAA